MRQHPAERALTAYADRELRWWERSRVELHLRRCGRCRAALDRIAVDGATVRQLLGGGTGALDVEEAMGRVLVRAGRTTGNGTPVRRWAGWVAVAALLTIVLVASSEKAYSDDRWSEELRWLMNPDSTHGKEKLDDRAFITRLHDLETRGALRVVEDRCCDDRDGEGPADDGLVFLTLTEEDAGLAVIYEDLDGSTTLTTGDLVRLVSRTLPPPVTLERHGPQFRHPDAE